eukprot:scaffold623892_cov39-Prasinocladus_malaysianus.AAC.1
MSGLLACCASHCGSAAACARRTSTRIVRRLYLNVTVRLRRPAGDARTPSRLPRTAIDLVERSLSL